MNKKVVLGFLGKLCFLEAGLILIPEFVSVFYKEGFEILSAFLITQALLLVLGALLNRQNPKAPSYTLLDGFIITSASWFLLSFFGGLPFVFSGEIPSLLDATFEMASGFTTTGASILTNVEALSQSMLFWRSFSHLIGGMGILVFAFTFVPEMGEGSVNIMKAEVPGPEFGKLTSKNQSSASILYTIYLSMTVILFFLLVFAGLRPFDAIIHAFGAAGTGGFSNKAQSVGFFHNPAVEYILSFGMLAFGINFNLYYLLLRKRFKRFFQNEELRLYLTVVVVAIILVAINIRTLYGSFEEIFRNALFTISTIITTTGYATVDFALWPLFSRIIILILMFLGSMAGSTAGGLKMSRILIYIKTTIREIRHSIHPRLIKPITVDRKPQSEQYIKNTFIYLAIYLGVFTFGVICVSLSQNDFLTAFSSVVATLNNIGPGLGQVGPSGSFASFTPFSKVILIIMMIAGRLEIYPVLILLMPRVWKNDKGSAL